MHQSYLNDMNCSFVFEFVTPILARKLIGFVIY